MSFTHLSGKTAFVTGASSGLGKQIALQLARSNVSVLVIAGRDAKRLQEVATEIQFGSVRIVTIIGDMGIKEDIERMAGEVEKEVSGKLDIFIGNHGAPLAISAVGEINADDFSSAMDVNFTSMVRMTNLVVRFMNKGGAICFTTSTNSTRPCPTAAAYCCAKSALKMFVKVAAVDLGPK